MRGRDIRLASGDLTAMRVDAIVNAANPSLMGGGGVDGAIHAAAGPRLAEACASLAPCPTGDARITPGFDLPATWVIHTVGPVWRGGNHGEANLLASCYRSSLDLAARNQPRIRTIAFPSISTGAYGYPVDEAARVAIRAVANWLDRNGDGEQVTFVLRGEEAMAAYRRALDELAQG